MIENSNIDPSRLEDPVAKKVKWDPLHIGGYSFRTHKLLMVNPHDLQLAPTLGSRLFSLAFVAAGMGFMAWLLFNIYPNYNQETLQEVGFQLLIGAGFTTIGLLFFFRLNRRKTFSKQYGYYWEGNKGPAYNFDYQHDPRFVKLASIHAIQLLKETVKSKNSSFYSYELNLILENGERINVVDHGNRKGIIEDAKKVADFLNVPTWSQIE